MYFNFKTGQKIFVRSYFLALSILLISATAFANCEVIEDGKSSPFNGELHTGTVIEKKSLVLMNKLYPRLNIIEKMFKGEILTCTSCSDKHVTCKEDPTSATP